MAQLSIPLSVLASVVYETVAAEYEEKPVFADDNSIIKRIEPKLNRPVSELTDRQKQSWDYIQSEYQTAKIEAEAEGEFNHFRNYLSNNFKRYLRRLNCQDIARITHSTCISMGDDFTQIQERLRPSWVFRKILLSSWHWKFQSPSYNQCVDAYNKLSKFEIGVKDFAVGFDTSSNCNKKGFSKYTRTYIDAELAYIIYYKNQHVLTVSFNTILEKEKTIQIRQIQCKNKKGNRWMHKLPKNYAEFIIDKFHETFDGYEIHLIKPETVISEVSEAYISIVEKEIKFIENCKNSQYSNIGLSISDSLCLDVYLSKLFNFDSFDSERIKKLYGYNFDSYKSLDMNDYFRLVKL